MLYRIIIALAIIGLLSSTDLSAQNKDKKSKKEGAASMMSETVVLKTSLDSLSYAIGVQLGTSLKRDSIIVDWEVVKAAATDVMNGNPLKLTETEMMGIMNALSQQLQEKDRIKKQAVSDENKKMGNEFLETNGKKPGVITTPSGLQYKVIKMGEGKKPADTSEVTVHYTGKLISGKVFDSSVERGQPATFPLNGVIPGWTEGLQLMPEGSKFEFAIPPHLGYGERGQSVIGPNEVLIFEVELIKVN